MWPIEPRSVEINVDKIKQLVEQHGWYWLDGGDATANVVNVINCVVATMRMHDAANRSMTKRYQELAQSACEFRRKIMDEVWVKAKNKRDEWHRKWQQSDSKLMHYRAAIESCPVPGGGWGDPKIAVKQCEEYRAWYFKWIKPITDKEPMR